MFSQLLNAWRCNYRGGILVTALLILQVAAFGHQQQQYLAHLNNPYAIARNKEVISINRNAFKNIGSNAIPLVMVGKHICISQLIDEDLDGKWDDLLVEVSLKPNSRQTLAINWLSKSAGPNYEQVTNVRFSLKSKTLEPTAEIGQLARTRGFTQNIANPVYQMEGPAIENDKVAFRNFFDKRNSEDIYGKLTTASILEKVGLGSSWHTLQSWGMDIFKTGNSLGAGGMAIEEKGKIYRLADADTTRFQVLYEGTLKAAFKLTLKNWDVGPSKEDGTQIISMDKGDYYYRNDINVNISPDKLLIYGIANFGHNHILYKRHNARWSSLATYGGQAEGSGTKLGVAVMFPTAEYAGYLTTDSTSVIPNTTYVRLKNLPVGTKSVRFFACWEKTNQRFSTQKGFQKYLDHIAMLLAYPIKVSVAKNNLKS